MPVNLSPEAVEKREKYLEAKTLDDKIRALQEYISAVPKHKGSENLINNLKKRLVKLKGEKEKRKDIGKSGVVSEYNIKKDGAGQVVIVGFTNSGKSLLFNALTKTTIAKVGDYPFTTARPEIGMMPYKDIKIQLIELPSIQQGSSENRELFNPIRTCDLLLLAIDLSRNPTFQMNILLEEMELVNIRVGVNRPDIKIEKMGQGGIVIIARGRRIDNQDQKREIIKLLQSNGFHNARVSVNEDVTIDQIKDVIKRNLVYKNSIIVATKGDIPGSIKNYELLKRDWSERFQIIPISTLKSSGIEELRTNLFKKLNIIRVYTRDSDHTISSRPIVIKANGTVEDVAKKLPSIFIKYFKYAYLSRKMQDGNKKMTRIRIGLTYQLQDKDIIQIYT